MIIIEYILSTFGFIIFRLYYHSKILKDDTPRGYCRRILVWAELKNIKDNIDLDEISNKYNIEVMGILNSNPLYWNVEYKGIRVFGNESVIKNISAENDTISTIAIYENCELTKLQKKNIFNICKKLRIEFAIITKDGINFVDSSIIDKKF